MHQIQRPIAALLTMALPSLLTAQDWPTWGGDPSKNMASAVTGVDFDVDPGKRVRAPRRSTFPPPAA